VWLVCATPRRGAPPCTPSFPQYVPPAIELGPPGAKKPAHYRQLPAARGGPAATARSWRVGRVGPEEPRLAVSFGLGLVVVPAQELDVGQ